MKKIEGQARRFMRYLEEEGSHAAQEYLDQFKGKVAALIVLSVPNLDVKAMQRVLNDKCEDDQNIIVDCDCPVLISGKCPSCGRSPGKP